MMSNSLFFLFMKHAFGVKSKELYLALDAEGFLQYFFLQYFFLKNMILYISLETVAI